MKTIFVSSTFRDMHYERDTIHERVLPDLNEHAAQYGDSIAFCDLRWGVNTGDLENEEGSRKVLSVCFDEIDRCRPYMLVILGERYGWIPEPELTRETVGSRFILEDLEKSVTALEIEYGALSDSGRLARTLFYFREFDGPVPETYQQEDEYHAHKLEELKERIRKIAGDRVRTYHVSWDEEKERLDGMEDFSRQLIQDLKEMMQDEWIETASLEPFGRDQRFQWDFARQKAEQFRGRRELIDHLEARLKSEENLHAVTGAAGCGKSSLMSSMAVRLDEAGYRVLPIFCGSTVMTNCAHDIVSYIVRFLEECVGAEHFEEQAEADQTARRLSVSESKIDGSGGRVKDLDAWTKRLNEMVWNYAHSSEKELIILVDAVDQLFPDEARENLCFIPENLPDGVQMVVSFLDTFQAEGRQYLENVEDIGLLVQEEKTGVIQGILQSLGRELETAVIRKIEKKPGSDNPLYLSLIIQRLVMMNKEDFDRIAGSGDGMSAITAHQIKIVESLPETVSGLCADILKTASGRIGGRIAEQAVQYIAASRYGLRESDLSRIFAMQGYDWKYGDREIRRHGVEWNSLEFALFIKYMRSFFILRDDGRWDFAHRTIREGIEERSTDEKECHQQIVNGLEGLDDRDPVKMTELLYHLCQADAREEFIRCMKDRDMSDKEMFDATADQIKTIILTDSGEWICRVIDEARQYEKGLDLSECITQTLRNTLRGTKEELELNYRILEHLYDLDQALIRERHKEEGIFRFWPGSLLFDKMVWDTDAQDMAAVCRMMGDDQGREKARILWEKIDREWAKPFYRWTWEGKNERCICCGKMGELYRELGGEENLEQALKFYQKKGKLLKQLMREKKEDQRRCLDDLQDVYLQCAKICKALGEKYKDRRRKTCQKGLKVTARLIPLIPEDDEWALFWAYMTETSFYMDMDIKDGLERVKKVLEKVDKLELVPETVDEKDSVGRMLVFYADICRNLDQDAQARKLYERGIEQLWDIDTKERFVETWEVLYHALKIMEERLPRESCERGKYQNALMETKEALYRMTGDEKYKTEE